mgnify:CR=1 FL=1
MKKPDKKEITYPAIKEVRSSFVLFFLIILMLFSLFLIPKITFACGISVLPSSLSATAFDGCTTISQFAVTNECADKDSNLNLQFFGSENTSPTGWLSVQLGTSVNVSGEYRTKNIPVYFSPLGHPEGTYTGRIDIVWSSYVIPDGGTESISVTMTVIPNDFDGDGHPDKLEFDIGIEDKDPKSARQTIDMLLDMRLGKKKSPQEEQPTVRELMTKTMGQKEFYR